MSMIEQQDREQQATTAGWRRTGERRTRSWRNVKAITIEEYRATARKCVVYLVNGKERRTPWFKSEERTQKALTVLRARHGNGIIFVD